MILNIRKENIKTDISKDQTIFVREGYGESYYFVLFNKEVYFCAEQCGELFAEYHICHAQDCNIKFPCYNNI